MRSRTAALFLFAASCVGSDPDVPADSSPASDAVPSAIPSIDYDVVVAGAGTGGIGAAIQAARMGARVALVEETDSSSTT